MNVVRLMTESDVVDVAPLCAQLGYPSTVEEVAARFANIRTLDGHIMLVATAAAGGIVGWAHAHFMERLHVARYADVAGIVVDAAARRSGAGRALMGAVEEWAKHHNLPRIRLRSGQHRTDAHAFYESIGYRHVTTPKAFEKTL